MTNDETTNAEITNDELTDDQLREIYQRVRTIAVVGASGNPSKPAYEIPAYLQRQGYRIIPVNPRGGELYGERVYPALADVDEPVDLVDVFRPPGEAETVADAAVAAGAGVLWFQPGTDTPEAAEKATVAGLTVITGRCLGATHGRLGLGPVSGPGFGTRRTAAD